MTESTTELTTSPGGDPPPGTSRGQLAQLAAYYQSRKVPAVWCAETSSVWVPGVKAELLRLPLTNTGRVDRATGRRLLEAPGIWVLSYLQDPTDALAGNCFNYLCRAKGYDIEGLSTPARRDIRRGLRNFTIRRTTWDELVEHGMAAYADTEARHGHSQGPADALKTLADIERDCPFVEIWGAWIEGRLSAWIKVLHVDDWAFITTACSVRQDLRLCPNNALVYEATRHYMSAAACSSVSFGISSLQATSNILPLHKFKVRMGYEAVPQVRTFLPHPLLTWLGSRPCSRALDVLARRIPQRAVFSKLAGMSRLLSRREQDPLAWARDDQDAD